METRNHKRNAAGGIDCELNHPVYGWIPFSAMPGDAAGADILAADARGDFGALPAYAKTAAELAAEDSAAARAELAALDRASIRDIRAYIASQADAPQLLKDREAAAVLLRARVI